MDERGSQTIASPYGELEMVQLLSVLVRHGVRQLVCRLPPYVVRAIDQLTRILSLSGRWDPA